MTTIRIHGILAKEYGESFQMELSRPRDVIRAIDASRDGFRKRVIDLQKSGFNYDILVNKKRVSAQEFTSNKTPKEIDIVPLICGSGFFAPLITSLLVSVAVAVISYALMDPGTIEGGQATVGDQGSLIFQGGAANVSNQGDPLPIGYGRLMVGSNVIQSTITSIPQTLQSLDAMTANSYDLSNSLSVDIRDTFIKD